LEQYSRNSSVRIYGIDDRVKNESEETSCSLVINKLNDKLNINIKPADVDIAHRIGQFRADGNRPIICKFVSKEIKRKVVRQRRQLKGTAIVIREDLTAKNAKLLENASATDGVKNAWSDEGKIIALLHNGKKIRLDIHSDLSRPFIPRTELQRLQ
jgi:hypothetical protein